MTQYSKILLLSHNMLKYFYYHTWPRRNDYNSFSSNWKPMGRSSTNRQKGRDRREPAAISHWYTTCVKKLQHVQRWALRQRCGLWWRVCKHWQKALPCPFLTIRTDYKLGKVHGNEVYQLKFVDGDQMIYYKNWCLWKECRTPHLMVIITTVICE